MVAKYYGVYFRCFRTEFAESSIQRDTAAKQISSGVLEGWTVFEENFLPSKPRNFLQFSHCLQSQQNKTHQIVNDSTTLQHPRHKGGEGRNQHPSKEGEEVARPEQEGREGTLGRSWFALHVPGGRQGASDRRTDLPASPGPSGQAGRYVHMRWEKMQLQDWL